LKTLKVEERERKRREKKEMNEMRSSDLNLLQKKNQLSLQLQHLTAFKGVRESERARERSF